MDTHRHVDPTVLTAQSALATGHWALERRQLVEHHGSISATVVGESISTGSGQAWDRYSSNLE